MPRARAQLRCGEGHDDSAIGKDRFCALLGLITVFNACLRVERHDWLQVQCLRLQLMSAHQLSFLSGRLRMIGALQLMGVHRLCVLQSEHVLIAGKRTRLVREAGRGRLKAIVAVA